MAEMIPLLAPGVLFESAAEEALYREMQSGLPDDWVVLYSIWIRKVKGKGHAEIDLLVISDTACLVIEVKGGICWKDADNIRQVIAEEIPTKVAADKAYQNAMKNSDKQNARIEHDKALQRVLVDLLSDHTELYKQFSDNTSFKKWLADAIFSATYAPPTA